LKALPEQAQVSPVYGIAVEDLNNDAHPDIILGGNLFAIKPEIGRYDALQGLVLEGDGKGNFTATSSTQSGVQVTGEVRHIHVMQSKGKKIVAVVRNNEAIKFYTIRK
jgi:enediyne biosynthesis protein E4